MNNNLRNDFLVYLKKWKQLPSFTFSKSFFDVIKNNFDFFRKTTYSVDEEQIEDYILIPSPNEGIFPVFETHYIYI